MFDRRLISNFDWNFFFICLLISLLGIINLFSAGSFSSNYIYTPYYLKQLLWLTIGLFLFFIVISVDYHIWAKKSYYLHFLSLLFLFITLFWGKQFSGAQRWLILGGVSFQPSEFSKLTLFLMLSSYFSKLDVSCSYKIKCFLFPTLITIITFVLIFLQPDLGTAGLIILVFISFVFFLFFGFRYIIVIIISGISLLPCIWFLLEEYQKRRVISFLNPGRDYLQAGYQAIQSKIAIGSGMLFGKGFFGGTQSQLRFLPEQHTDFVFSVWAEEWGFLGAIVLITLFFFIISKGLKIASQSFDRVGSFISIGLILFLFWQIFFNLGMVTGILPIVGIPLPFFSYGGSSLVSSWIIIGILLNIRMRKFMF